MRSRLRPHRPDRRRRPRVPPQPAERRRVRALGALRRRARARGRRRSGSRGDAGGHRRRRPVVHPGRRRARRRAVPHQRHASCASTRLPEHLIVLGGGFIASELGHVFRSLGSDVTIVNRSHRLLTRRGPRHRPALSPSSPRERFDLALGAEGRARAHAPRRGGRGRCTCVDGRRAHRGRRAARRHRSASRTATSCACRGGGIDVDGDGRGEGRRVRAHLGARACGRSATSTVATSSSTWPTVRRRWCATTSATPTTCSCFDQRPAPHAVFASPQIGAVGLTEHAGARAAGEPYCVITQRLRRRRLRLGDGGHHRASASSSATRGPARVIGAHVIGYQASMLVQLLVQGMHLGSTADEMALGQVWIHPALSEVVEQALLKLIDAFDAGQRPEVLTSLLTHAWWTPYLGRAACSLPPHGPKGIPMNKQVTAIGLTAGLLAGAGAGFILENTGSVGASNLVAQAVTAETVPGTGSEAPAAARGDRDEPAQSPPRRCPIHHGGRAAGTGGQRVRAGKEGRGDVYETEVWSSMAGWPRSCSTGPTRPTRSTSRCGTRSATRCAGSTRRPRRASASSRGAGKHFTAGIDLALLAGDPRADRRRLRRARAREAAPRSSSTCRTR